MFLVINLIVLHFVVKLSLFEAIVASSLLEIALKDVKKWN